MRAPRRETVEEQRRRLELGARKSKRDEDEPKVAQHLPPVEPKRSRDTRPSKPR